MIKKLLLLLTIITFIGCSDDDNTNYHFEYVPVLSADVPSEFTLGNTYELKVTYELPNNCYEFYHFEYLYNDTSRIVNPVAIVNDDIVCDQSTQEGVFTINVNVIQSETYTFKFWQGVDDNDEPIYLVIDVPVIN